MISLIALSLVASSCGPKQTWDFTVDASGGKPISPYIYGANSPDWKGCGLPFTLARQGGNRMTAYNWTTNASNAGNDWHNQNDNYLGASDEPGWTVRTFMEATQSHGAAALLTVPTAGFVAADKKGDGDVIQTPNYLKVRFKPSLERKPGGKLTYPPDPNAPAVYQDEFVHWVETAKAKNTPVWFCLDNEPDIWESTHHRIWPRKPTYAEIIANNIEFASAIKEQAPDSLVFGPESYGWEGFRKFQDAPDANGRDFLDVYLFAMQNAESRFAKRLLDVLDIHWYPEAMGDGVRITAQSSSPGTASARIQAPRSLWDPTYVEDSWITQKSLNGKAIALIPGIMHQIDTHYPGTKMSISEYNYGGNKDISGALAQADALGIFGRTGLFAACNWGVSPPDTAELAGYRAYLDFDGNGGHFGDQELGVQGETAAENSVYAALDSKNLGRLTIVAINKTATDSAMRFKLNGFAAKTAKGFAVTKDSLTAAKPVDVNVADGGVSFLSPALSVTTIEVRN